MGVNFIKKHKILVISKNCKICSEIKFLIENVDIVRYAYSNQKNLGEWVEGWMGGWMDGWVDGKAGLRIAYSNQKSL